MLDRIDERDKQERMHRSIVKYWNVNYIPTPYAEPKEEQTGEEEAEVTGQQLSVEPEPVVSSANYGNEEVTDEVTKGQIDKILHEKTEAIRSLIEQNKQPEEEQDILSEAASDAGAYAEMTPDLSGEPELTPDLSGEPEMAQDVGTQAEMTQDAGKEPELTQGI